MDKSRAHSRWKDNDSAWRSPPQVISLWQDADQVSKESLQYTIYGDWWDILRELRSTIIVTREYEHLLMALSNVDRPRISYLPVPHPSGLAFDAARKAFYVALTRNPNQIIEFCSSKSLLQRNDLDNAIANDDHLLCDGVLLPSRALYLPGCTYIHDLAVINNELHANSVGQNCVVQIDMTCTADPVWWPKCIDADGNPHFEQNYIQLNSIAAGASIENSFFSASADHISHRRPGHKNFAVDKRGIIFSGITREPMARGLTRPHSARLTGDRLFVDNSGYGELCAIADGKPEVVCRLPGWTRGLSLHSNIALVGTSRVLDRFQQYAPGLDIHASRCGIHAVDLNSGKILAGLEWPTGNQLFSIEAIPADWAAGFPLEGSRPADYKKIKSLFYAFSKDGR
jgi:uncharacterized protein (TIGR03032 family)